MAAWLPTLNCTPAPSRRRASHTDGLTPCPPPQQVVDEAASPFYRHNYNYNSSSSSGGLGDQGPPAPSPTQNAINGYVFCNAPKVCAHGTVQYRDGTVRDRTYGLHHMAW